jgi:hypothetical protein
MIYISTDAGFTPYPDSAGLVMRGLAKVSGVAVALSGAGT